MAYALKPGPGGAEAYVNKGFVEALAKSNSGYQLVVLHGNASNAPWMESLQGAQCIPCGNSNNKGLVFRLLNKWSHLRWGYGWKLKGFENRANKRLKKALKDKPKSILYARCLPFSSLAVLEGFPQHYRWANINDPMPPDLWHATYAYSPSALAKWKLKCHKLLHSLDGWTYPAEGLKTIMEQGVPCLKKKPQVLLRHAVPLQVDPSIPSGNTLVFKGGLSARNQDASFIEALKALKPEHQKQLTIRWIVPHLSPGTQNYLDAMPVKTELCIGNDEQTIAQWMNEAAGFLFLGFEGDQPLLYTKLCEYLQYNKPILGLCPPDSLSAKLLEGEEGNGLVPLGNAEGCAQIITAWMEGKLGAFSKDLRAAFDAQNQIHKLLEAFKTHCS